MGAKERLYNKINKTSTCWNYTGYLDKDGYGNFWYEGKNKGAHRVMWEIENKTTIPEGYLICHKCDNPSCINPDHLFLGTTLDNIEDKIKKGRQPKGEDAGPSKLTRQQVEEIKYKYDKNNISYRKLGKEYKVSYNTVHLIITGKIWK